MLMYDPPFSGADRPASRSWPPEVSIWRMPSCVRSGWNVSKCAAPVESITRDAGTPVRPPESSNCCRGLKGLPTVTAWPRARLAVTSRSTAVPSGPAEASEMTVRVSVEPIPSIVCRPSEARLVMVN